MKNNVIVVKGDGNWKCQVGTQLVSTHRTQEEAQISGKRMAQALGTDLVIQGRDGKFRSKDSYGSDPFPPRDREN